MKKRYEIEWKRLNYRRRYRYNPSEVKSLLGDPRRFPEFASKFLRIRTTGGKLVPFDLNPIQMWFHFNYVVPKLEAQEPVRAIVLKMRQSGISTYFQGLCFWWVIGHPNTDSLLVGQDTQSSRRIFRIMYRYHENFLKTGTIFPYYPLRRDRIDMLQFGKPPRTHQRAKYKCPICGKDIEIRLVGKKKEKEIKTCHSCGWKSDTKRDEVILDSMVEVLKADKGTTKHGELGRGGTYQFVHASEVAFWPYLTSSLSSLIAACHDVPDTLAFIETTANGYNEFHAFWSNMTDPAGREIESDWQRCFIPWYWDDKYELPIEGREKYCTFNDEYEEWLLDRIMGDEDLKIINHGSLVSKEKAWAKLLWRRKAIIDKAFGDEDYFKQEFPATDIEAFKFSGVTVFNKAALTKLERKVKDPIWQGTIEYVKKNSGDRSPSVLIQREDPLGRFKVWEKPDPRCQYIISADVAEGKAILGVSEEKSKWDFSVAEIMKVGGKNEPLLTNVACWHGNIDPDQFGFLLVGLARLYHDAYLVWEVNGPGRSLKMQIINTCRYHHYYKRLEMDTITNKPTKKPGWKTNRGTKPDAVSVGQRYIREGEFVTCDSSLVSELQAYSRLGENKYGAVKGHDDRVMATIIGMTAVDPKIYRLRQKAIETAKKLEGNGPKRKSKKRTHPILGTEW